MAKNTEQLKLYNMKVKTQQLKEFTFSVPCSLEYRILAHNEEEAKNILLEKGGYEIQGEISVEGSDYDNAILI